MERMWLESSAAIGSHGLYRLASKLGPGIVGSSPAFECIVNQVESVAPTDSAVLIKGESGTGKELIARAIHSLSSRRNAPFIRLNCATIPAGLVERELFGHERVVSTGAFCSQVGRFELADKGTLFLDEIGELPLELQHKLVRVLQEQEFERLGSARTVRIDVRILTATNQDLAQRVRDRRFRPDLYYRLNVFPISLPPLRARSEDIPALVDYFVRKFSQGLNKPIDNIPPEAMKVLQLYNWPGNIRELQNCIERAVIMSWGPILRPLLTELKHMPKETSVEASDSLAEAERERIPQVRRETRGSRRVQRRRCPARITVDHTSRQDAQARDSSRRLPKGPTAPGRSVVGAKNRFRH